MQDRIVGPLTMLQFIEAVVGGGAAYSLYNMFPAPLGLVVALLVVIFMVAILFVKINERPFSHFLLSFIRFMLSPKQRIWQKGGGADFKVEIYKANKNDSGPKDIKVVDRKDIKSLAKKLDSEGIDKINLR